MSSRTRRRDRELSARLYGGDQQIRISQEFVLGIGGVRALRALGVEPDRLAHERGPCGLPAARAHPRVACRITGLAPDAALWACRSNALFTTHTPVPAGNDAFPFDLMDRFFGDLLGRSWAWTAIASSALGRYDYSWGPQFSMTVLALRTAGLANGVSELHGEVSRHMWSSLWPTLPEPEVPIGYVTNGVHTDTWVHPALVDALRPVPRPELARRLDERSTWSRRGRHPR